MPYVPRAVCEGASTYRRVAKDMLQSGRKPVTNSERMILNNFLAMKHIRQIRDQKLTPELVFELHRIVTDGTLDDPDDAGRFGATRRSEGWSVGR